MSSFPLPFWLAVRPDPNGLAKRRFLLRLAALFATEEGTVEALSRRIDLAPESLGNWSRIDSTKKVPERMANRIAAACGNVVEPKDLMG